MQNYRVGVDKLKYLLAFFSQRRTLPALLIQNSTIMVVIRLRREGSKNRPFYRIVAADQRFRRDGRFLDIVGTYDPLAEKDNVQLDLEKADAWIQKGAQPTETVRSLIKKARKAASAA